MKNHLPQAEYLVTAPGRVNLLGEHVDYNGGSVLPAAIDRYVKIYARASSDKSITLHASDMNQSVSMNIESIDNKEDENGLPLPDWALYPAGVAWALKKVNFNIKGIECAYTSNLPIGAGLSSSAAVEVGFATLWKALGNWEMSQMDLAKLCQIAENEYVGVNSGLMDQFAVAHGIKSHILHLDTKTLQWQAIPFPEDISILIADSKVRRTLVDSAYNERRQNCEQATSILKEVMPEITALGEVHPKDLQIHAHLLPHTIYLRAKHVIEECDRVREAIKKLEQQDIEAFGKLMFDGHNSLRDQYQVSIPELDFLVDTAASLPGCLGARLTGAGFGGCTVNLVKNHDVDQFSQSLETAYNNLYQKKLEIHICKPSEGATFQLLEK